MAASTGSVTLANIKLSLINGTAFVDFSAANSLTPYLNYKLKLTDSAGKSAIGYIKTAGVSETFGSELITDQVNRDFSGANDWAAYGTPTSFDSSGDLSITGGGANKGAQLAAARFTAPSYGGRYRISVDATIASGAFYVMTGGSNQIFGGVISTTGAKTLDRTISTSTATTLILVLQNGATGAQGDLDNFSLKQQTAPGATGVTIVSTPHGLTYNWASIESGFNYYDGSGYTYVVYPVISRKSKWSMQFRHFYKRGR